MCADDLRALSLIYLLWRPVWLCSGWPFLLRDGRAACLRPPFQWRCSRVAGLPRPARVVDPPLFPYLYPAPPALFRCFVPFPPLLSKDRIRLRSAREILTPLRGRSRISRRGSGQIKPQEKQRVNPRCHPLRSLVAHSPQQAPPVFAVAVRDLHHLTPAKIKQCIF